MTRPLTFILAVGALALAAPQRGPLADVRPVGSFELRPCTEPPRPASEVLLEASALTGNGVPSHAVGAFPNSGNPNTIAAQEHAFTLPEPSGRGGEIRRSRAAVAINGVPLDPGTAEYWQDDRSSGWRYEALSGAIDLGLDCNHGHVQPDGAYHYHGVPEGLVSDAVEMQHVGWAADGYPLYARFGEVDGQVRALTTSYRLRSGTRSGGPGGAHDGTFVQDWEYVEGLGDLDRCNAFTGPTPEHGVTTYYLVTDTFPFVPRCTVAEADESFAMKGPPPGRGGPGRPPPR
ncbi:MAG: YHYH protein [Proteobacteria bacterium]|nr:YHYH protein [Pseudomonadota bacterium]MCP4918172.1 YHYH protein [Pseudomonadota bacterium]